MQSHQQATLLSDYREHLSAKDIDRDNMEYMIMEYLMATGYLDTAMKFANESSMISSLQPCSDVASAFVRTSIRKALQLGDCQRAIELIEEFNPGLLLVEPYLRFPVYLQQLIEYIRQGEFDKAIEHAQNKLAVYTLTNSNTQYLIRDRLERSMALLAFKNPEKSTFKDVFSIEHRKLIADEVNSFLLNLFDGTGMGGVSGCLGRGYSSGRVGHMIQTKLAQLFKLLEWTQTTLINKRTSFVSMEDVETMQFKEQKYN